MIHLVIEEGGFHSPGAVEAPAADRHFMNGKILGGGGGCVLLDEGVVEEHELIGVFVAETDGVGGAFARGEAVADGGIGGGASFAFGSNRPVRLFPVGTRGGATAFG